MRLSRLQIRNIRNIEYSSVDLGPKVNLFAGENGSGKTSILESVHFLSSGRSFRSGKENTLLKKGADGCLVRGISETGQEMSAYRDKVKGRRMTLGRRILDRAVSWRKASCPCPCASNNKSFNWWSRVQAPFS